MLKNATASQSNTASIEGDSFVVLCNAEAQYALWPAGLTVPDGWDAVAPPGSRSACVAYVEAYWTDMRPRSLRRAMEETSEPSRRRPRAG